MAVPERSLARLLLEPPASLPSELVWWRGDWIGRDELAAGAGTLAAELRHAGVQPGSAVASLLPTSPPALAAMVGVWAAGGVLVPLNPRLTAHEVERAVDEVDPVAVVAPPDVLDAQHALPGVARVEQRGLAWRVRAPSSRAGSVVDPEIALVLYTSGTTGRPKPVLLRHTSILDGLDAVLASIGGRASKTPMPNLIPFSLNLWSGLYNVCFSLRVGAPIVLMSRFEPKEFARLVERFGIRSCVLAPGMLAMLLDESEVTDLSPLRLVRNATAPLSPQLARRFQERFGVAVLNGYGQTELGGEVVGWNAADVRAFAESKLGAVGRPHPGVEIRIADDAGDPVPAGEVGELCVRSPYAMAGYVAGDAETTARRTPDGLLRTGDLGRLDDDGFLWLAGRRSDVINRSGLKVFPDEVEEALRSHPAIADVAVAGVPDPRVGEVPWAFVVPRDATSPPADLDAQLERMVRERLAPYKVPARFIVVDALPRNDIGKVLRRELSARYGAREAS